MNTPLVGSSIKEGISLIRSSSNELGAFKKILGPKRGSKRTSSNPINRTHNDILIFKIY